MLAIGNVSLNGGSTIYPAIYSLFWPMYTHTRVGWPSPVLYGHEVMTPAGDVGDRAVPTCIRLLFRTDTDDLTGGVRRGKGAMVKVSKLLLYLLSARVGCLQLLLLLRVEQKPCGARDGRFYEGQLVTEQRDAAYGDEDAEDGRRRNADEEPHDLASDGVGRWRVRQSHASIGHLAECEYKAVDERPVLGGGEDAAEHEGGKQAHAREEEHIKRQLQRTEGAVRVGSNGERPERGGVHEP